jgi:hypothetical protein
MPYLTNSEGNELNRLKTTIDEGFSAIKSFGPQKNSRSSSIGYWGGKGDVGFGFKFGDF